MKNKNVAFIILSFIIMIVALSENMKIAGINIAGSFTLLGHHKVGYMIPYDIVENNINNWRNK